MGFSLITSHRPQKLRLNPSLMRVVAGASLVSGALKNFGSAVASVDADASVMPYLELVAELNEVEVTPVVARFEQLDTPLLGATDWLIAADVCFWEELVDPVTTMIERAIESGTKRIMISDPRREPFFTVANTILSEYGGELVEWRVGNSRHSGVILVIENA